MEGGKIYGIKGKNGSGKAMLMRSVCGLIIPTKGKVVIDGETLGIEISFPRSIGAFIESPGFIANYSGFKNLRILASIQNKIDAEEIKPTMTRLGLDPEDQKRLKTFPRYETKAGDRRCDYGESRYYRFG